MSVANYSILDTLAAAATGWGVVFATLAVLILLIWVLRLFSDSAGRKISLSEPERAAVAEPPLSPVAPALIPYNGSQGELALYEVDDETAAMVMAVVADWLETPLNELRFQSIREQDSQKEVDVK